MEKGQKTNIGDAVRSLIMTACLAALIFFGSIMITVGVFNQERVSGGTSLSEILIPLGSGSMATNEHRDTERSITLSMPALVNGQTLETVRPHCRVIEYKSLQINDLTRYSGLSTKASISPEKALEFTLVGAKPSGTS
nr:hypothetical protein [candidate division Zixibacteria bacterium]